MSAIEPLLVGLVVLWCALFSAWRLMSVRLRLKVLDGLAKLPASAGGGLARTLRGKTLAKLSGGCAACAGADPRVSANVRPLNQKTAAPRR